MVCLASPVVPYCSRLLYHLTCVSVWLFRPAAHLSFTSGSGEVKVQLRLPLTPPFHPCNPWPAVAPDSFASGRCEAHLRQPRHAL